MLTVNRELIETLETERRKAQSVADACEQALTAFRALEMADEPAARKARTQTLVHRIAKPHRATGRPKGAADPDTGSQCGVYADAIVRHLSRPNNPLRCGEGKAIREAVLKDVSTTLSDSQVIDAIRNAFTRLKAQGRITRKGTIWTLTEKAVAA